MRFEMKKYEPGILLNPACPRLHALTDIFVGIL